MVGWSSRQSILAHSSRDSLPVQEPCRCIYHAQPCSANTTLNLPVQTLRSTLQCKHYARPSSANTTLNLPVQTLRSILRGSTRHQQRPRDLTVLRQETRRTSNLHSGQLNTHGAHGTQVIQTKLKSMQRTQRTQRTHKTRRASRTNRASRT
jgi:hypothetical protein